MVGDCPSSSDPISGNQIRLTRPGDHTVVDVSAHPAARAWQRLQMGSLPVSVHAVKFPKWKTSKTVIYRLLGCAAGHAIIAKYCEASSLDVEWRVYMQILGPLRIDLPHCYGYVVDPDGTSGWLFLEEVSGVQYSEEDSRHRSIASSWLGNMHSATGTLEPPAAFPPLTLDRYWDDLESALASLSRDSQYPVLTNADRLALTTAERGLERLARQRSAVSDLWSRAPHCLVHGDFFGKNVLVDERSAEPKLRVLDWERSRWGVPMEDLAGLDIPVYGTHAAALWQDFGEARLRLLAEVSCAFRAVACLEAYSAVDRDRFIHVIEDIAHYGGLLECVEDHLGW